MKTGKNPWQEALIKELPSVAIAVLALTNSFWNEL